MYARSMRGLAASFFPRLCFGHVLFQVLGKSRLLQLSVRELFYRPTVFRGHKSVKEL
jgi:hypothetical protein